MQSCMFDQPRGQQFPAEPPLKQELKKVTGTNAFAEGRHGRSHRFGWSGKVQEREKGRAESGLPLRR